ncbi:hypothetical protein M885DRAFT_564100 [Pelagophyceae sp. CCMP2097]|nr:hypothetical protein M885DRAFT_564100 [Pelagophyceae sp. CCMP2097]
MLVRGEPQGPKKSDARSVLPSDSVVDFSLANRIEAGSFSAHAETIGTSPDGPVVKLQKAITAQREEAALELLNRNLALLDPLDLRRQSPKFADRFSSSLVTALPTFLCAISNEEWAKMVAGRYGLPSPACAPFVGRRILDVELDKFGHKLKSYPHFVNHKNARGEYHDANLERLAAGLAEANVPCSTEVFGLFANVCAGGGAAACNTYRGYRDCRRMVPDLKWQDLSGAESLGDVKTIANNVTNYGRARALGAGKPVDIRAAKVPDEYNKHAQLDAVLFDQCATLVNGTVRRLYASDDVCACGSGLPDQLYQIATDAFATFDAVDYYPTGSTVGKDSVLLGLVDFAGSDSALSASQYAEHPDAQMYVATASAVVPAYNLEALAKVGASLVLDRETLPMIFLGDIFEWTDPRILDLQNSQTRGLLLKMPDVTIRVVVRDDGSGTTEIFTNALSAFSGDFSTRLGGHDVQDWCEDGMEELECPGGVYTDAAVLSLPGSIGYFGVADANQALLVQALLINKAGFPVLANGDSVDFTLLELGGFLDERGIGNLIDASGFRAYPIVGFTYFVVRKGFHDGVNYMDNAAEMFDCGGLKKVLKTVL